MEQAALAARWGFAANYIYMLETGRKPIPAKLERQIEELEREAAADPEVLTQLRETAPAWAANPPQTLREVRIGQLAHLAISLPRLSDAEQKDVLLDMERIIGQLMEKTKGTDAIGKPGSPDTAESRRVGFQQLSLLHPTLAKVARLLEAEIASHDGRQAQHPLPRKP